MNGLPIIDRIHARANLSEAQADQYEMELYQEAAHSGEFALPVHHIGPINDSDVCSQLSRPSVSSSTPEYLAYSDDDNNHSSELPMSDLERLAKELQTDCWINHRNFCLLRRLALSNHPDAEGILEFMYYDREIEDELNCSFLGNYSTAQRNNAKSLEKLVPITGRPFEEPDVLTAAVLEDCPECFDLMCQRLPQMDCSGCNKFGWSFLAIAIYARSYRMLEYLFDWDRRSGSTTLLMFLGANAIHMRPGLTPLSFVAQQQDARYLEYLLDLWEPHLRLDLLEEHTVDKFIPPTDRYAFCRFVNYDLATRLAHFGLPIYNTVINDLDPLDTEHVELGNAWHAAASNGTDFLDFLEKYSRLSKTSTDANGRTPLNYAVRARRFDLVRWFKMHESRPGNSITQGMSRFFLSLSGFMRFCRLRSILPGFSWDIVFELIVWIAYILLWGYFLVSIYYYA